MAGEEKQPKVSVCVVTYNHEAFIEECLRGILRDQITPFEIEVIVADDCSTDGTGRIVDAIASDDRRVRVLRPAQNIGVTQNLLAVHNAARGEYVVHLDGDDVMFAGKLAAQVELLDQSPELSACGHVMLVVDEAGDALGTAYPAIRPKRFSLGEVVRYGMPFLASSLMYRRTARALFASDRDIFDWYFLTDILRSGPAALINESLGAYRVNANSITANLKRRAMRERMLGLYAMRLAEHHDLKADFFCHATVAALSCLKQRDPLTRTHLRLLRQSFTPKAFARLPDAIRWARSNVAALTR